MSTLRWSLVSTIAALALAACPPADAPNPTFDSGDIIYCTTSDDCPEPLLCIDFACRPEPPDAGQRDLGARDRMPGPDRAARDAAATDSDAPDTATAADVAAADTPIADCGCPHPDSGGTDS